MCHTGLCDYIQTRAYIINKGSVNLNDQVLMEITKSEGVGELLFTFAYIGILTVRIHGWKLWSYCSGGLIVEGPS